MVGGSTWAKWLLRHRLLEFCGNNMASPLSMFSLAFTSFSRLRNAKQTLRKFHIEKCLTSNKPDLSVSSLNTAKFDETDIDTDQALKHKDFFGIKNLFTVKDLFDARIHFGHKDTALNDKMKQFIFGIRANQAIFDLDITAYHLREALNFAAHIAFRGGIILFVGRSPQNCFLIEETAKECGEYAHTRLYAAQELTNSERRFNEVVRLPDLLIFLTTLSEGRQQHRAVHDAAKMNIPSIGVVDSNCDPNLVTYPIPGNDDSPSSMVLYCKVFKEAILLGKKERAKQLDMLKAEIAAEKEEKARSLEKARLKIAS